MAEAVCLSGLPWLTGEILKLLLGLVQQSRNYFEIIYLAVSLNLLESEVNYSTLVYCANFRKYKVKQRPRTAIQRQYCLLFA